MRDLRALVACLLLLVTAVSPAAAVAPGRRLAVIVGVSRYGGAADLSAPVRNAEQMATTLGRLGYDVRLLRDRQAADILATVRALKLQPADTFAFFFSGHGLTANGTAALVIPSRGGAVGLLRVDAVTGLVAAAKPAAALYMLDACRSNETVPLAKDAPGLAAPPKTLGAFFAYAAAPGDVAYDGPRGASSLSPFTFALVEELQVPGQDMSVVMRHVRERVATSTKGRQLPWSEDSLTGPLVLNEAPASPELAPLWGRVLKGEAAAERELGLAYLDGRGVEADVERGTALLKEAGRQNDVAALLALGDYELKRDRSALLPSDGARADYALARKAGSTEAAYRLAELDRKALPVGARPTAAMLTLYREASAGGSRDAHVRLLSNDLRWPAEAGPDKGKPNAAARKTALAALRTEGAAGNMLAAEELGAFYHALGAPEFDNEEGDYWLDRAVR